MRPILRALRLFGRERGLWAYAIKPLLFGIAAYALVVLTTATLGSWVGARLAGALGEWIGAAAGAVVTVVFGGAIYLALVGLIAGFGFDALSMEVERREFRHPVGTPRSGLGDGVARAVLAGVCGIAALCLGFTVVGPWLVAAFLCLMDFTAPALLRRGVGFGRQFGVARRLPEALPFALVSGVVVLIPVLNVLALPILVAAGTILVAENAKGQTV